jgi:hypothetical protein
MSHSTAPFNSNSIIKITRGPHRGNMAKVVSCTWNEIPEDYGMLHGTLPFTSMSEGWYVKIKLFGKEIALPVEAVKSSNPR